jgi:hypothetical protein
MYIYIFFIKISICIVKCKNVTSKLIFFIIRHFTHFTATYMYICIFSSIINFLAIIRVKYIFEIVHNFVKSE